jgi:hypothetical protein
MQEELFSLLQRMGRVKRIHKVEATSARVGRLSLSQYHDDIISYHEYHPTLLSAKGWPVIFLEVVFVS